MRYKALPRKNRTTMKTKILAVIAIILLPLLTKEASAKDYEFAIKAGMNLGGTSPMGLPAEIREIITYSPTFSFSLEGNVKRNITDKWGVISGVRFDIKGMSTDSRVKNYQIVLQDSGETIEGIFTGDVETKVSNSYITVPLLASYNLTDRWALKLGGFVAFAISTEFSGTARNGYMHEGSPIGDKIEGVNATYNFSNDVRTTDAGVEVGVDFKAFKHLIVSGDLTWGLIPIFDDEFTALSFNMYNVYMNLAFGYQF